MTDKLPNEILIKILDFWKIDDFKNQYFNLKSIKPVLDYIIKKNNFNFVARLDMIFENIIFKYYPNAIISCRSKFYMYDGFIEKMFQNKELSICIWKEKCKKYNYNLEYMSKILGFLFEEELNNYDLGKFKKRQNHYDITINQSLFMCKLINNLNK